MIIVPHMADQHVAVLGLGKSGMAAARVLKHSGANVAAWDDDETRRAEAAAQGIPVTDLAADDLSGFPILVLSPGIPHSLPEPHPVVARAKAAGCEIIGDAELLARAGSGAAFIGVTGTNGKSTTTALIGHILCGAGRETQTGGNLGTPALALKPLRPGGFYVLEMSSYQLELVSTLAFNIAVLLNISPDHLGRHGGLAGYIAAKRRIFGPPDSNETAVVGIDDCICRGLFGELKSHTSRFAIPVSGEARADGGVYVEDGWLINDIEGRAEKILDLEGVPSLPGAHNGQNAAAAFAVARAAALPAPQIAAAIRTFPGLPHRQEKVARIGGVLFVNDSKATNAEATARALACHHNIFWIAGGRPKEEGIEGLAPWFGRIRHAFLIGEAADGFAQRLAGKVPFTKSGDLATALEQAHGMARKEGGEEAVVLLSPACASFDQWRDFEERGDSFRRLVGERARADASERVRQGFGEVER